MANFSTKQNRQFYVAKAYSATVDNSSDEGTIGGIKAINNGLDKELYFLYKGADTVLRSDIIQLKNLNYVKAIKASDMVVPLKSVKVSVSGSIIKGEDYVLGINFRAFFADSDKDTYYKNAVVHATAEMVSTPLKFYQAMVASLNLNFAREVGATATSNPYLTFSASASGVTITEKEQGWTLGVEPQRRVYFDAIPTTIYDGSEDVQWGVVADLTPAKEDAVVGTNAIGNGKKIADLEYFCMGERGDQYRNMGWPNVIATKYLVDASQEYNLIELHYAFTDEGVNSYRSEKDITIAFPMGAEDHEYDDIDDFIEALNTATGLEIPTLAEAEEASGGGGQ